MPSPSQQWPDLPPSSGEPGSAVIIGCGLIGTSIGLGLARQGWAVELVDRDETVSRTAAALGAGRHWGSLEELGAGRHGIADVAIAAVPPRYIAQVCSEAQRRDIAPNVMHVASVQSQPQREIEELCPDPSLVVGTHPMAGRERGGPSAASDSLFIDRPWVICGERSARRTLDTARRVVAACGGNPVEMSSAFHDRSVALVSHLPQLMASILAGRLNAGPEAAASIAGSGMRDMTRLAGADSLLWQDIIVANRVDVLSELTAVIEQLNSLQQALGGEVTAAATAVDAVIRDGQRGRALLGGKHGKAAKRWASVQVVVPDEPGALVAVLTSSRDNGINVEDLTVEHASDQPMGILDLQVDPTDARRLAEALAGAGWTIAAVWLPHE